MDVQQLRGPNGGPYGFIRLSRIWSDDVCFKFMIFFMLHIKFHSFPIYRSCFAVRRACLEAVLIVCQTAKLYSSIIVSNDIIKFSLSHQIVFMSTYSENLYSGKIKNLYSEEIKRLQGYTILYYPSENGSKYMRRSFFRIKHLFPISSPLMNPVHFLSHNKHQNNKNH